MQYSRNGAYEMVICTSIHALVPGSIVKQWIIDEETMNPSNGTINSLSFLNTRLRLNSHNVVAQNQNIRKLRMQTRKTHNNSDIETDRDIYSESYGYTPMFFFADARVNDVPICTRLIRTGSMYISSDISVANGAIREVPTKSVPTHRVSSLSSLC